MFSKKNKIITFYVILAMLTLSISFAIGLLYFNSTDPSNKESDNPPSQSVSSNISVTINSKTKIVSKILYTQSGTTTESILDNASLIGKTQREVNDIYSIQGYKIEKFTSDEVILTKSEDKYSADKYIPGKYVLGIKDGFIAIFRADSVGKLYIEDSSKDITNIKTTNLKQADIDMLYSGTLQYDNKDDAEGSLEDYR